MAKRELWELQQMQAMPLHIKVKMTQYRIKEWIAEFGEDGVYVSFSGGKDSTVLLHLVRELYPNIKAVFVDTGLEYPEIRDFVKTFNNVEWLKPKKNFKQVIKEYGYPFFSKEVSQALYEVQHKYNPEHKEGYDYIAKLKSIPRENLTMREKQLLGIFENKGEKSAYNKDKYLFALNSPFLFGNRCCNVMKKAPAFEYQKQNNAHPFIATMTEESRLRKSAWMQHGCNGFDMEHPQSTPMSFWTEQDVLNYIKINNIKIAPVYGDVVPDSDQITLSDLGVYEEQKKLKTTGCNRTGCMFCGYGCQSRGDDRFLRMKETHPKQYNYIMRPLVEGGGSTIKRLLIGSTKTGILILNIKEGKWG